MARKASEKTTEKAAAAKAWHAAKTLERYHERRANGLCTRCGKTKTDGVHHLCARCRAKNEALARRGQPDALDLAVREVMAANEERRYKGLPELSYGQWAISGWAAEYALRQAQEQQARRAREKRRKKEEEDAEAIA
jgi:5-methylcytosine-specific restriction endonuclease McrA